MVLLAGAISFMAGYVFCIYKSASPEERRQARWFARIGILIWIYTLWEVNRHMVQIFD